MNTELNEYIETLTAIRDGAKWEVRHATSDKWQYPPCERSLLEYGPDWKIRLKPPVDMWAAEKAAFADGQAVQFRHVDAKTWTDIYNPAWMQEEYEYRVKPWALGRSVNGHTLAEGQEWHRQDFTEDMLPDGWRPLINGERSSEGDSFLPEAGSNSWRANWQVAPCAVIAGANDWRYRTRRPLPVADPYAALKAAHARGEVIEHNTSAFADGRWRVCSSPRWSDPVNCYRVKPVMVKLTAADVPPFSALRQAHFNEGVYESVVSVNCESVKAVTNNEKIESYTFDDLEQLWQINRSIPLTGRWNKDAWERCEKAEVQP